MRTHWITVALVAALAPAGCVKKSTYQGALDDFARTRADLEAERSAERADHARQRAGLEAEMAAVQGRLDTTREALLATEARLARLQDQFDEESRERARLEAMLRSTGAEAEILRGRVDALSAIEAEIRSRNQIYEDMIGRFRSLIDAGQLTVSIVSGRMVLQLPQDILFPSGSAELNREGRRTLAEIGQVLAQIPDRRFQVEGHTDDVPIATSRFPSNWELSSGRALAVVHLLLDQGVRPENLSGAAYGEFQPVADNTASAGRMRNRRIEIAMLPNLNLIAEGGS